MWLTATFEAVTHHAKSFATHWLRLPDIFSFLRILQVIFFHPLVHKSFCNTVCIGYDRANKATYCCCWNASWFRILFVFVIVQILRIPRNRSVLDTQKLWSFQLAKDQIQKKCPKHHKKARSIFIPVSVYVSEQSVWYLPLGNLIMSLKLAYLPSKLRLSGKHLISKDHPIFRGATTSR